MLPPAPTSLCGLNALVGAFIPRWAAPLNLLDRAGVFHGQPARDRDRWGYFGCPCRLCKLVGLGQPVSLESRARLA
jgi:hypothetical protein